MQVTPAMLARYDVVLRPDRDESDWWAGAPSIVNDARTGKFFLAARMRDAISTRGRRGYEIRLLESDDGKTFSTVKSITRDEGGVFGYERAALVQDPSDGRFVLYGSAEMDEGWTIWRMDPATSIDTIDPSTLQPVLRPRKPALEAGGAQEHHATFSIQYKDPFITWIGDKWHMLVIGFDRVERPYRFTSKDGVAWQPAASGKPILPSTGWHDFFTRPACLLPLDVGWLLVYEGSNVSWFDPGYNIATGLAYTLDLDRFVDLTPDAPAFTSPTPGRYHTWRYSHWLRAGGKVLVYHEAACTDGTNETRLAVLGP